MSIKQADEIGADLKALRNQRQSNTGHDRPRLSALPYNGLVYGVSGITYGGNKYADGNFYGDRPEGVEPVDRLLEYIDAAMRHLGKVAHAIYIAKGTGGDQRAACALPDDEASGGFPASNLPHIAHAISGLLIAVECGVADGLLPKDPGQPWKRDPLYAEVLARRGARPSALAQKDNADAEHVRVHGARAEPKSTVGDRVRVICLDSPHYGNVGTVLSMNSVSYYVRMNVEGVIPIDVLFEARHVQVIE